MKQKEKKIMFFFILISPILLHKDFFLSQSILATIVILDFTRGLDRIIYGYPVYTVYI